MGVNPYFIEEYKLASPNYSMKDISQIFNYLLEADKKSKGIDFDNTNYHAISSELIYKIFNIAYITHSIKFISIYTI